MTFLFISRTFVLKRSEVVSFFVVSLRSCYDTCGGLVVSSLRPRATPARESPSTGLAESMTVRPVVWIWYEQLYGTMNSYSALGSKFTIVVRRGVYAAVRGDRGFLREPTQSLRCL